MILQFNGLVFFCVTAYEYVTCGSALKLLNTGHNVRLHSHDVKYGSGSGQQVGSLLIPHTAVMFCIRI